MEYKIEGKCVVTLDHTKGEKTSKHVSTDFNLNLSPNLDRSFYFDKDDMPNENAAKALTQAFVQGLVGNIHYAHQKDYWNDADHIRYVIEELKKGFVRIANVYPSTFE